MFRRIPLSVVGAGCGRVAGAVAVPEARRDAASQSGGSGVNGMSAAE
ncbi:MAG TPA: hypothetical protein VGA02_01235 [Gemmatimonadales bacterium]